MKALVISDRAEIIDFVTPLLKKKSFDIIHYRWIIKALDNIEEIQPDIIVLSAMEYPRHWKTLAGFVQSGIGGNDVKLYLYDTKPLSTEDAKKAYDLHILSFEEDFKKSEDFNTSEDIVSEPVEIEDSFIEVDELTASTNVEQPADNDDFISMDIIDLKDVDLAFNDKNGKLQFCEAKYNPERHCVELMKDSRVLVDTVFLKYVSMQDGNRINSFSADVKRESDSICFYIKDYYEEKI